LSSIAHLVRPRSWPAVAAFTAVVAVLIFPAGAGAAILKRPAPKPAVGSFAVTPARLDSSGGPVSLRARVSHAARCTFLLQQGTRRSSRTVACASGSATTRMMVAANGLQSPQTVTFTLTASAGTHRATAVRRLVLAAKPPPPPPLEETNGPDLPIAVVGNAYMASLTATGGTGSYHWRVTTGTLPAGLTLSSSGAITGVPAAPGGATVTVEVDDDAQVAAEQSLTIAVGGSAPPGLPPSFAESTNWSGYNATGGPFTAVSGTFNVPQVPVTADDTDTSEWLGIDGVQNSSLIQAGVSETVSGNQEYVYAWWEILPAPAQPISSLAVNPGDEVTVAIVRQADASWLIQIEDLTDGDSWHTVLQYSGPLNSAEWIVEAPTDVQSDSVRTLGQYTPPVTFKNLGLGGPATALEQDVMVSQDGAATPISTPSSWSAAGFTVAYGSGTPPPPG
jgi:hypothetical protein